MKKVRIFILFNDGNLHILEYMRFLSILGFNVANYYDSKHLMILLILETNSSQRCTFFKFNSLIVIL